MVSKQLISWLLYFYVSLLVIITNAGHKQFDQQLSLKDYQCDGSSYWDWRRGNTGDLERRWEARLDQWLAVCVMSTYKQRIISTYYYGGEVIHNRRTQDISSIRGISYPISALQWSSNNNPLRNIIKIQKCCSRDWSDQVVNYFVLLRLSSSPTNIQFPRIPHCISRIGCIFCGRKDICCIVFLLHHL